MLSEIEFKEMAKQVESLDMKDRKLIDITRKLIDNYFIHGESWNLCKVYSVSVNPRGIPSVLYTCINANRGTKENSWCVVKYFFDSFRLADKKAFTIAMDQFSSHLKK